MGRYLRPQYKEMHEIVMYIELMIEKANKLKLESFPITAKAYWNVKWYKEILNARDWEVESSVNKEGVGCIMTCVKSIHRRTI